MIDELELLLGEGQEEPEEVPALLKGKGAGAFVPRGGGTASEPGEAEALAAPPFGELPRREGRVFLEDLPEAEGREGSARTLYRTLTRVGRAARTRREPTERGRIPLLREERQSAAADPDILRLDRAFQRDARRYDGGFTWQ